MDFIELTDFSFKTIVGILPRERVEKQTIEVGLRLFLDLDAAAFGDLSKSVNYADMAEQARFLAQAGQWWLLESYAAALCSLLLAPPAPGEERAQIDAVELLVHKPEILGEAATPGIGVRREAGWRELAVVRPAPGVTAETLQIAQGRGAWRVTWEPGADWKLPQGSQQLEICATVDGGRTALVVRSPPLAPPKSDDPFDALGTA